MGVLLWILVGLVVSLIGRSVYSADLRGGTGGLVLAGIVGAVFGGWLGNGLVGEPLTAVTLLGGIWAVIVSVVLLVVWSLATTRRRARPRALP